MTVDAHRLGEEGFVAFLTELVCLGVPTGLEKLEWLTLHGAVIRAALPPLDEGSGIEQAFADVERGLRKR